MDTSHATARASDVDIGPRLAAGFDARAWREDVLEPYPAGSGGRRAAELARTEFERDGVPLRALATCEPEGRDRSRLEGALKLYLPLGRAPRSAPFGMVFSPVRRSGEIALEFLAFGVRHQPPGSHAPSVYEIAHRRLHGRWP